MLIYFLVILGGCRAGRGGPPVCSQKWLHHNCTTHKTCIGVRNADAFEMPPKAAPGERQTWQWKRNKSESGKGASGFMTRCLVHFSVTKKNGRRHSSFAKEPRSRELQMSGLQQVTPRGNTFALLKMQ